VTTIDVCAFDGCSFLTAIAIPDGVTTIGERAFMGCSSLTAINIPDGVTTIGDEAFRDCSALTKLILSPAVSIGEDCFSNCTALIAAAADKNMPTVSDLLHYRWHRNVAVIERVNALLCLKGTWDHVENQPSGSDSLKRKRQDGAEAPADGAEAPADGAEAPADGVEALPALRKTPAREKMPKVLWRVVLEFL
jgi:hypothetical protein